MNSNEHDKDIDWDKVLHLLDEGKVSSPLSKAELSGLAAAREMRVRLGKDKFAVEDGWQLFVQARDRRKVRILRLVKIAAAALLVLTIGAGLWLMRPLPQPIQVANEMPSGKVRLKLADGRQITMGKDTQHIQQNGVAQIQAGASSLEYTAGTNHDIIKVMDTLEVPRGLQFNVKLSDGTQVWLSAGSRLIYPAAFNGATREVYMQGEVFFEVAPDARQPFIVHTGNTALKVLGTAFNVNTFGTGVTTTLSSGRLLVTAGEAQTMLLPEEQVFYDYHDGSLYKKNVDTRIFTAWKEGDLFFEDAPLRSITDNLGRNYDYAFIFEDKELEKLSFTLDMRRPAVLQDVLNLISRSMSNIQFRVEGSTIYVTKRK
jgi:transmembrane sensor